MQHGLATLKSGINLNFKKLTFTGKNPGGLTHHTWQGCAIVFMLGYMTMSYNYDMYSDFLM